MHEDDQSALGGAYPGVPADRHGARGQRGCRREARIYNHAGLLRVGLFVAGATLLFGYGGLLNLAPLEFGKVIGMYIATLFVVWQVINFLVFHTVPTPPILLGGALIVVGGAIVSFWKPA